MQLALSLKTIYNQPIIIAKIAAIQRSIGPGKQQRATRTRQVILAPYKGHSCHTAQCYLSALSSYFV
jgi:hypothetical protein